MKNFFYLVLSITILVSCNSDNQKLMNSKTMKMNSFVNAPIGKSIDGDFQLLVEDSKILAAANKYFDDDSMKAISYEIFDDNNKKYLRVFTSNDKVVTVMLKVNLSDGLFRTLGTTCESNRYANGGGCMPQEDGYCSECKPYGPQSPLKGDCTRKTTSQTIEPA